MRAEIDISGKIEHQCNTVLGMGGGQERSILITKRQKDILWELVDRKERKRQAKARSKLNRTIRLFAILCHIILIGSSNKLTDVVIDHDYWGHDGPIRADILNLRKNQKLNASKPFISFDAVGKGSAHVIALETFRGKRNPTLKLSAEDVFQYY